MKPFRLISILLVLCLLCTGCSVVSPVGNIVASLAASQTEAPTQTGAPSEQTEPTDPKPVDPTAFLRKQNGGARDYLPDGTIEMPRFADIEYTRPDVDELCSSLEAVTDSVRQGADAEEILSAFFDAYDLYYHFYSMNSLANIRYYADMSDEFYKEEYEFCEQASPDIEEKLEACFKVCAESPQKADLEEQYFGDGFLDQYVDYSVYTNPEYLALSKQEKTVMEAYHKALEDPQIEFEGKKQSFEDLVAEYEDDGQKYISVLETYYNTYNPVIGGYFAELIRIRRQMAQVLGYDSYADYCYEQTYSRDYSREEGEAYVADIRSEIVPLYAKLSSSGLLYELQYGQADEETVYETLSEIVGKLGEKVGEVFSYMTAYDLYDISRSAQKMDTSFTTYIYEYEAPYLLVNAQGTSEDLFTFAHEFGHFTDNYLTYNAEEDLETAETFSQGMEWLVLCNSEGVLSRRTRENARLQKLADTVSVFISQAAYTDFENRVYSLSDRELTVDALNDIYRQVCKDYGFYSPYADFYYSMAWIDIPHFFEAPYYMISYCVSADTALQIYQRELEESGSGLALYGKLLEREEGAGLRAVIEAAGMENPFEKGRIREIVSFLQTQLDLDD